MNSNVVYFIATTLASIAFITSLKSTIDMGANILPINPYTMFVATPVSSKSATITNVAQAPIQAMQDDFGFGDIIINKPTSSAMQRILSDLKMGILLSGEIYDPLNKVLKSDGTTHQVMHNCYVSYLVEIKLPIDLPQKTQGK